MNRYTVKEILRVVNEHIADELAGNTHSAKLNLKDITQAQYNIVTRYFEQSMIVKGEPAAIQNIANQEAYYNLLRDLSITI